MQMRFAALGVIVVIGMATSVAAQQCADSTACLGLAENAACTVVIDARSQSFGCGICSTRGTCVRGCVANTDQTTCTTAPTCTKATTGSGGIGILAPCGSTNVIRGDLLINPTELASVNGILQVTMSVQLNTWNATAFSLRTRQFCSVINGITKCSTPGPTIRVKPGDRLDVTLMNNLPTELTESIAMNKLRIPNTVNLHTHGLRVDPTVDNVMETISPGSLRTYRYEIPTDHHPGTHWYHSHAHGSSALQMLGGMSGFIVVDPVITMPASYTAMTSHMVHLTHIAMCSCNPTNDPFALRSYPYLQAVSGDNLAPHGFTQAAGFTEKQIILANGQYQPRIVIAPGSWHRLEVLSATGDLFLELEIRTGVGSTGSTSACTMMLLARDGIFLTGGPRSVSFVLLPMAGRASIAVMCPTAGTYYFQSNPQNRASAYEAGFLQNLVTLEVSGATVTGTTPSWTSANIPRPYYLQDLRTLTPATSFEIGVEQTGATSPASAWLGVGRDCTLESSGRGGAAAGDPNAFGSCAYVPFSHSAAYRFAAPTCSVVDMIINGRGATPHPIHMHVHPMQIIEMIGNGPTPDTFTSAQWGQVGDFIDTVPALAGRMRVRFRADAWVGPIMIHCHMLVHEDSGMMDRWWSGAVSSTPCVATSVTSTCNSVVPAEALLTSHTSTPVQCEATTTPPPGSITTTRAPGSTTATVASTTTTTSAPRPTSSSVPTPVITVTFIAMCVALVMVI